MNEFIYDSMLRAKKAIGKSNTFLTNDIVVVGDEHELAYLLCGALCMFKNGKKSKGKVNLVIGEEAEHPDFLNQLLDLWPDIVVWHSLDEYLLNGYLPNRERKFLKKGAATRFFLFANLRSSKYSSEQVRTEKLKQLGQLLNVCTKDNKNYLQLITCIPSIREALPIVTNAIAEREYEVIFRDYPEDSLEKYVIQLEEVIRNNKNSLSRVQVLRMDRVFGPGITSTDDIWINEVLHDIFVEGRVVLYDRDRHDIASACYSVDALKIIMRSMLDGRKGNIYHVSSWSLSRFQIIEDILSSFPERDCVLDIVHEGWNSEQAREFRVLNAMKLRTMKKAVKLWKRKSAIQTTAYWYSLTEPYVPRNDLNVYYGRMNRIRELELDLLKEVDKICKENGIQYFLSAGTMLGAIRHKSFIPWDDDVDICMLPEEYDKFLKICPEHLSVDYGYQNFAYEKSTHYIHDKIRIKDTYFSTKYTHARKMMNGVYIDVFVYYKTSDLPLKQNLHIKQIKRARKMLGIHWRLKQGKSKHRFLYPIAYKVLHKVPSSWLHKYHSSVLRKYENKNTHYRLDSTGFNLEKVKAVPDEWFHDTIDVEFCGYQFPVPAHYDDYLRHWYGDHYMEILPPSSRSSVHDIVRIDLGKYLFDETIHDQRFRHVDLRGELYEQFVDENASEFKDSLDETKIYNLLSLEESESEDVLDDSDKDEELLDMEDNFAETAVMDGDDNFENE